MGQNLGQNLEQNLGQNLGQFENIYWGNVDIYWLSFYIFPQKYLNITYDDFQILSLNIFSQLCKRIGWIWYFRNTCFISDRPIIIHKKGILLHSEKEPAISFKDGYSIWCLNGINVPRWLVDTPAEKIDPKLALEEKNVDIQREIIRKIGAERMLKKTNAKLLDTWDETSIRQSKIKRGIIYKLYEMNIGERIRRKYLVYEHASMEGITYANAVPPETQKALHGRAFNIKLVNREDLKTITQEMEAEIIANLPAFVS